MTALLDSGVWHGQIYSGGWVGALPIVEPGTGSQLGRAGLADASDVATATATAAAAAAQPGRAATNFEERAAVPRGTANLDAFTDQRWITIRGDIPGYPF